LDNNNSKFHFDDEAKLNKPAFGSSEPRKIGFKKSKDYKN